MKKIIIAALLALSLAACKGSNNWDLEGVPGVEPQNMEVILNIDRHPNVVRFCVDGYAYYTVSKDQVAPFQQERLTRVPEWDKTFCGDAR